MKKEKKKQAITIKEVERILEQSVKELNDDYSNLKSRSFSEVWDEIKDKIKE